MRFCADNRLELLLFPVSLKLRQVVHRLMWYYVLLFEQVCLLDYGAKSSKIFYRKLNISPGGAPIRIGAERILLELDPGNAGGGIGEPKKFK